MSLEFWCPLRLESVAARRGARTSGVVRTGMGPRRSAAFAAGRHRGGTRTGAVVLGLAGALGGGPMPGDVVVADEVRGPGAPRTVRGREAAAIESLLREAGLEVRRGPVISVARPVRGEMRRTLSGGGALVADMESWWLLAADPAPLAVVRVVSDTPSAELASLSLPWRVRRALAVISRIAATLDSWETPHGPDIRRGLETTAPGGSS